MASNKKPGPEALAFIVAALKANKDVSYGEVKEKADKKGLSIYPVMYGRAKALLGLVKVAPRGEGRFARAKQGLPAVKRGPGRPPKSAAPAVGAGLDGVLAAVRNNEAERLRLRATLEKLHSMIADALGS